MKSGLKVFDARFSSFNLSSFLFVLMPSLFSCHGLRDTIVDEGKKIRNLVNERLFYESYLYEKQYPVGFSKVKPLLVNPAI